MKLHRRFNRCADFDHGCAVTIGNYDGVHRGHCELIRQVRLESEKRSIPTVVMSFDPSPQEFFQAQSAPARLTTWRERYNLLKQQGVDHLFLVPFDGSIAKLSPDAFTNIFLQDKINARLVYVGDDFRYGHKRAGDVHSLQEFGGQAGFEVHQLSSVTANGQRISSSMVRASLHAGEFTAASAALGRPYTMSGRVVRGQQLGRTLGFPTANIRPGRLKLPLEGVFAVRVAGVAKARSTALDGIASLGFRPTVGGTEALLEVHLFDFAGDLYGQRLAVEFVAKIRDEERFESLDLMVARMHHDVTLAQRALNGYRR